jgi:mRNA interferase RelE/StbE
LAEPYDPVYRTEVLEEDLPEIPRNLQKRILSAIERRLMTEPVRYGTRLRRSLSSLWKLRVGDYRVVYEIRERTVRIWTVAHRKKAYEEAERRTTLLR